jgi:hypothetical protein
MNRCVMTLLVAATFCVVLPTAAYTKDTTFECPDDQALQLLEMAVSARHPKHGFKDSIGAFSYVIKNANRPMDEVALRAACRGLAHDSYITEKYGPVAGVDVFGLIPPKEAVGSLRDKHPVLSRCSDHSLYESQLPVQIRGSAHVIPKEAVRLVITGWVDLELEVSDDGIPESARIVGSSNSILEPGVIDHVLTFRYPKSWHYNGQSMRRKGFEVRITTDYFDIAREKGCEWDDPWD